MERTGRTLKKLLTYGEFKEELEKELSAGSEAAIVGLIHGTAYLRLKEPREFRNLVDDLINLVSDVPDSADVAFISTEDAVSFAAQKILVRIWMNGRIPLEPGYEEPHALLLGFLSQRVRLLLSSEPYLQMVQRYLHSLCCHQGTALHGEYLPHIVRALCMWGFAAELIETRNPEVIEHIQQFLQERKFPPKEGLLFLNRGLHVPHHIPAGDVKWFGNYRTALVLLHLLAFNGRWEELAELMRS